MDAEKSNEYNRDTANFRWMHTCLLASVTAVELKGLKITGGCSNLYLRQNITSMHSQKKNDNSLECELAKRYQEIEKLSNPHVGEI
jgi:hypothetical protein